MPTTLAEAQAVLENAGERWLDAKASGKDTTSIDAEVEAATRTVEELSEPNHQRRTT